jgi:hypothetical protein
LLFERPAIGGEIADAMRPRRITANIAKLPEQCQWAIRWPLFVPINMTPSV